MRSKKGEMEFAQIWEIGQALMLVVIFFALLYFVRDSIGDTLLEKNYIVRDNALILSTVLSAPGNIYMAYPNNLGKFGFEYEIGNGYFKLKNPQETLWSSYRYGTDHTIKVLPFKSSKVGTLFYSKGDEEVEIGSSGIELSKKINCPEINTTFHGWEARPSFFNATEDLGNIKATMAARAPGFTDVLDASLQDNIILVESSKGKGVVAYINHKSKESHKMGCVIVNRLSESINVTYAAVVLVEPEGKMKQFLREDKNAVLLKIGEDADANKNALDTVNAIYDGIEDFYEK